MKYKEIYVEALPKGTICCPQGSKKISYDYKNLRELASTKPSPESLEEEFLDMLLSKEAKRGL